MTETFPHIYVPTIITINSWITITASILIVLGIAHLSVVSFLKNLDLVGVTKVRE